MSVVHRDKQNEFQTGNEEDDIAELVAVFKGIAKTLKLKVWNDQHLEDVLIS